MALIAVYLSLVFIFGLISHRLSKSVVTGPMVFTIAGIFVALLAPSELKGAADLELFYLLSKITLAVLLFKEGSSIWLRNLRQTAPIPVRMLTIGMPISILVGAIVALLIWTDLSAWEAAILATILAPTDAGLGMVVVTSKLVPERIREALSVEAGLNDGLSVPFLMLFLALSTASETFGDWQWIVYFVEELGYGIFIGLVSGLVGGWLLGRARAQSWIEEEFEQLVLLSLAVLTWYGAEHFGGNGFIAAFVAGLSIKFGYHEAKDRMIEFSAAWGDLLNLAVFFIFGVLCLQFVPALLSLSILYAVLSLTLVRMVPVGISLLHTGFRLGSVLFLGWFGPRGLASIVLGMIYLAEEVTLPGQSLIITTVIVTVYLSIFLHGLTAYPGIQWYASKIERFPSDAPEVA